MPSGTGTVSKLRPISWIMVSYLQWGHSDMLTASDSFFQLLPRIRDFCSQFFQIPSNIVGCLEASTGDMHKINAIHKVGNICWGAPFEYSWLHKRRAANKTGTWSFHICRHDTHTQQLCTTFSMHVYYSTMPEYLLTHQAWALMVASRWGFENTKFRCNFS